MSSTNWGTQVTSHSLTGVDGTKLRVYEAGAGPAVVLAHGFPELAHSWRHQVPALVEAGYRVIVPDQRGYGESGQPKDVEAYDIEHLVADLAGVLDQLDEPSAHFIGHDWGSIVVWQSSLLITDRVRSVAGLSVPFTPRSKRPPTQAWVKIFGDSFFYILYFQEPGVADADLGRDPATTMRRILAGSTPAAGAIPQFPASVGFVDRMADPERLPDWLSEDELRVYVDAFTKSGFTGALNWYRNFDRNWDLTSPHAEATVTVPSLFIGGTADPVLATNDPASRLRFLDDHRGNIMLEGAGHWIQQERPQEVNVALITFLDSLD